jgi:sugar lactone lactonase YvrE
MFYKTVITSVLAFALATISLPLAAQTSEPESVPETVPALWVKSNKAYAAKDYLTFRRALERLHEMRPNNSEYMYQLVIAHALLDEKSSAYNLMLQMQQQGLAYDFNANDDTKNIRNTQVFDYVSDLMKRAEEPMGESEPAFTLPDNVLTPETMVWDESRNKFLVGTLAEGSVLAVGADGQVSELIKADDENGMWAVFGILVDQARNRLWVSSAATPLFSRFDPSDRGRSALFEFDLETLQLLRRYPVPVDGRPHILGSMVLGPEGDIYIMDRALPILYKKSVGEQKLKAVVASRDMISARGLAMQPDGSIIYAADREMGILVIDIKGSRAAKLVIPETLNLGGIDGLYLWNNHLVAIQNGIKPQRVMRLQLDASGTKVTAVRPLAVAQPEFDFPNFGTVKGDDLYYFANSQSLNPGGEKKAVTILRTPLDSSSDLVPPDMQQFQEEKAKGDARRAKEAEKN